MSAVEARRQDVRRLIRFCDAATRLIEGQDVVTPKTSSPSERANWRWDVDLVDPTLGRGSLTLRLTRHGGAHVLSLFGADKGNPLMRISEKEILTPEPRRAASRATMLATMDRMRTALEKDMLPHSSRFSDVCAALVASQHPRTTISTARPPCRGRMFSLVAYDEERVMRQWTHPPTRGLGSFSEEAARAVLEGCPAGHRIWISAGGLSGRARSILCSIDAIDSIDVPPMSPIEVLRTLSELPEGARLIPPAKRRRRRQ
jgi:hypothetical protein